MASTTQGTMNDPKGGVAKITCPTFEAMGQIPTFHRTYFLFWYEIDIQSFLLWVTLNRKSAGFSTATTGNREAN